MSYMFVLYIIIGGPFLLLTYWKESYCEDNFTKRGVVMIPLYIVDKALFTSSEFLLVDVFAEKLL